MAQQYDSLNTAERLALSLAPGASPASWQFAERSGAANRPVARRHRPSLIAATAISLFALAWVLALDLFTIRAGQPGAVFFRSETTEAQAFSAIIAAGGLPIRPTTSIFSDDIVWIAAANDPAFFSKIVGQGALIVVNPLAFDGCFLRSGT